MADELAPGDRVWVEAVALDFDGEAGPVLHVIDAEGEDRATFTEIAFALSRVHWRRMPDDTTAEPDARTWPYPIRNDGAATWTYGCPRCGEVVTGWVGEANAETAYERHLANAHGAVPDPIPAGVPDDTTTDPRQRVLDEIGAERLRQDEKWGEQNHPDGTGPELVWSFTGPAAYVAQNARQDCQDAAAEHACTWKHILLEEIAEAFAESDSAKLRAELVQVAAVAAQWIEAIDRRQGETVAAVEPLAAGVPVGALTDEPGPGAYLIGDLLAVRCPGDDSENRWLVQTGRVPCWFPWGMVHRDHADKPIRRLLPHTQPATATFEVTGDPLTLDAIRAMIREEFEITEPEWSQLRTAIREVLDARDDEEVTAGEERDDMRAQRDNLAAENARLRQQRDQAERAGEETYGRDAERLRAAIAQIERERDEARRQLRQQSEWNQSQANIIREARRERDTLRLRVQRLASEVESQAESAKRLERLGDDDPPTWRETINQRMHIAQRLRTALAADAPAQTPGGNDAG